MSLPARSPFRIPGLWPKVFGTFLLTSVLGCAGCFEDCRDADNNGKCDADERTTIPNTPDDPQPVTFVNVGRGDLHVYWLAPSPSAAGRSCLANPVKGTVRLVPSARREVNSYGSAVCYCYGPGPISGCGSAHQAFPNQLIQLPLTLP